MLRPSFPPVPASVRLHSLSDTQLDSQATDSQGNGCEVSATQPATDSQIYEMYGDGHPDDTPATSTSKSDVFALAETIYQHLCSGRVADVFSGLEALANHGVVIEEATLDALQFWECQCRMKDADVTQHTFTHARGDGAHCPSPCQRACSDVPMISQSDKNAIQSPVAMRVEDQHSQGFLVTNPAGHGPTQGGDVTKRNRFASFAEIQVAAVWSSHQRDQAQRAVQEFQGAVSKAFQGQADRSVKFAARVLVDGPFEVATRLRSFLRQASCSSGGGILGPARHMESSGLFFLRDNTWERERHRLPPPHAAQGWHQEEKLGFDSGPKGERPRL